MTSSYGLHGRAALVTGGTRGIGREVARQPADACALVCVTARDPDDVRRTAAELGGIGLAGSVADPAHPSAVKVEAPLRLVQAVWRGWMREHGGSVVNVCTEGAGHVGPNVGAYGTGKAALLHLTRQLAGELAPRVRVNSVSPGPVRTEMARFVWEKGPVELPPDRIGEPRTSRGRWCGSRPTRPWRCPRASAVRAWGGSPGRICRWTGARGCGRRTRAGTPSMTGCGRPRHPDRDRSSSRKREEPDDDHQGDEGDQHDREEPAAV